MTASDLGRPLGLPGPREAGLFFADKRRCVEIALREFPKLSNMAIAKMCGVSDKTVEAVRGPTAENPQLKRTGQDGKERPAHREPTQDSAPPSGEPER